MSPSIITSIETFRLPPRWLFVRVTTSDGYVGWGEATLEGHTEAVEGVFMEFRDRFVLDNTDNTDNTDTEGGTGKATNGGTDADNIEDIWQNAYRMGFYRGGPVLMSALSGLDIALWDIKGKKLGVPIWQLLGGKVRDRIRVYGWIGGDRPDDVFEGAKLRKEQGFTAVKMNATDPMAWLDSPNSLTETVSRVAQVKSIGLDVGIDFHGRLHKPMAKQLAKLLEPLQPLFIEEPLLPTQPEEIADLAHQTSCPIATGERLFTRHDFRPYLERRAMDIAQPDVAHCGGISELKRIAALTEMYDVALAPHCPMGPIALAACMQVGTSSANYVIQEMSWQIHYNQGADLFTYLADYSVFDIKNGYINVLEGPGLGINIDEEKVRKAAEAYKTERAWRNAVPRGPDGCLQEW